MTGNLKLLIPPEELHIIINRIARDIRADYAGKDPVLIGVLKGASVFLSDLIRAIKMPLEIDFVQTSSYGERDSPSEQVAIIKDITSDIRGREVILVEGIVDRGHTARELMKHFNEKEASSVRICTLLLREGGGKDVKPDYVGTRIDKGFVVGYGMDYKERFRYLPGIYILNME